MTLTLKEHKTMIFLTQFPTNSFGGMYACVKVSLQYVFAYEALKQTPNRANCTTT